LNGGDKSLAGGARISGELDKENAVIPQKFLSFKNTNACIQKTTDSALFGPSAP